MSLADLFDQLRQACHEEECGPDDNPETIIMKLSRLRIFGEIYQQYRRSLHDSIVDWIDEFGEFEMGDIRYYAGTTKTWKCRDVEAVVEHMLTNYSIEDLISLLVAQPFKRRIAMAKNVDPNLFESTQTSELKEGKPRRTVQTVNRKWIKPQ